MQKKKDETRYEIHYFAYNINYAHVDFCVNLIYVTSDHNEFTRKNEAEKET